MTNGETTALSYHDSIEVLQGLAFTGRGQLVRGG